MNTHNTNVARTNNMPIRLTELNESEIRECEIAAERAAIITKTLMDIAMIACATYIAYGYFL